MPWGSGDPSSATSPQPLKAVVQAALPLSGSGRLCPLPWLLLQPISSFKNGVWRKGCSPPGGLGGGSRRGRLISWCPAGLVSPGVQPRFPDSAGGCPFPPRETPAQPFPWSAEEARGHVHTEPAALTRACPAGSLAGRVRAQILPGAPAPFPLATEPHHHLCHRSCSPPGCHRNRKASAICILGNPGPSSP